MAEAAVVGSFGVSLGSPPQLPPSPGPLQQLLGALLSSAGRRLRRVRPRPPDPRAWLFLGGALGLCEAAGLDASLGLLGVIGRSLPDSPLLPAALRASLALLLFSSALWLLLSFTLRLGLRLLLLGGAGGALGGPGPPPRIWLALVRMFAGRQPGLLSLQGALPALPLPHLSDTVRQAVESLQILDPGGLGEGLPPLAQSFLGGAGPQIQSWLNLRSWVMPSYLSDLWEEELHLGSRDPLPTTGSYYLMDVLGSPPTRLAAARAANLTFAFLRFRKSIREGTLPPVLFRGSLPTCSAQYEKLFDTTRIPGEHRDSLRCGSHLPAHLAVFLAGRLFRLPLRSRGGKPLSPAQLQREFQKVLEKGGKGAAGEGRAPQSPAVLSAGNRTVWAKAHSLLRAQPGPNSAALQLLEDSPFVVAFDPKPQNGNQKPQNGNQKPQNGNQKPQNKDPKSQNRDPKSQNEDLKSQQEDLKSQKEDSRPQNEDFKSQNEDFKPKNEDFESQNEDSKPQNYPKSRNEDPESRTEDPKSQIWDSPPEERDPPQDGDLDQEAKALLLGPAGNRWFDKSLTLVVFPSGRVGLSVEHSWGDPPVAGHLWEFSLALDRTLGYDSSGGCLGGAGETPETPETPESSESPESPQELHWELPQQVLELLPQAQQQFQSMTQDLQLHVVSVQIPPGAAGSAESDQEMLQVAMELALLRERGPALTYEPIPTRLFLEGRADGVRGVSRAVLELEKALRDPEIPGGRRRALLQAALSHGRARRRAAMTGAGLERHLQALAAVANQMKLRPPFLTQVLGQPWALAFSSSPRPHPPLLPHPLQPAGGGFNPPHQDGYGVSFTAGRGDSSFLLHICCRESSPKTEPGLFSTRLRAALGELGELGEPRGGRGEGRAQGGS